MTTLTVTAKGQVTLRKDLLDHLGVAAGDKIAIDKLPDGRIEVRAAPSRDLADLFGLLKDERGPKLSIDEIDDVIRRGWAGE